MAFNSLQRVSVTNAGLTQNIPSVQLADVVYIDIAATLVLAANVSFATSDYPPDGTSVIYVLNGGDGSVDLNGFTFTINGVALTQIQLQAPLIFFNTCDGTAWDTPIIIGSQDDSQPTPALDGGFIADHTITLLKLGQYSVGAIPIASGPDGDLAMQLVSGDMTISSTGVAAIAAGVILNADINASASIAVTKLAAMTALKLVTTDASGFLTTAGSGVIVNADINASAAIALSKLAAVTALKPVVSDASGLFTTVNQIPPDYGGNGIDNSAATGFPIWTAGTNSVGALTETIRVDISFVTAAQGTYYVALPACTVTKVKARVTSALSGTDDGTIQCQNASSTNMTAGLITVPLSSAHGTGVVVTPSASNTFTAGQEMQLVVAKTTSGGTCSVDITFTRTALT